MRKTINKIDELTLYKKAITDAIYGRRWREIIEDKLQNLESYHIWDHKKLPPGHKVIGSNGYLKLSIILLD